MLLHHTLEESEYVETKLCKDGLRVRCAYIS